MDLFIIAGPNGAGKTTFAREFLPNYADCKNFVNADLIAQGWHLFLLRLPHSVRGR
jgi:predicted ABC-type ATPase